MGNVVYFRGLLSNPFNISNTVEEIIYNDNNEAIGSVNMMYQKGKLLYSEFESMNSNILELPYGSDGKFCMLVIFPYPGTEPSVVYRKFEKTTFRSIFMKLENDLNEKGLQEVVVKMPRFSLRGSYILNKPLNEMGVYDAFEPDYARFQHIGREALYISSVEHKADIVFGETETVALAATPGYFEHQNASYLKAQQPFLFFLMEKPTASIIFGGIYSRHRSVN
ncbi:jg881 [Pararge aegeria aegeria]|uniref:Jg881 protein n=1 Tax=Pararge aegeria aegeria TaxID=348720 RepID=A0A8S4QEJ8_9NEOP|nr:jg881 [Pararge aegeria aegeria]